MITHSALRLDISTERQKEQLLWLALASRCHSWCVQGPHGQSQPCTAGWLLGPHGQCASWEELSHLSLPLPKHMTISLGRTGVVH